MATSKEQLSADQAAYADEFDQEHPAPDSPDDDQVFGLADEIPATDTAPAASDPARAAKGRQQGQIPAGTDSHAAAAAPQGTGTQDGTQQAALQAWEARLQARQQALDAKEAALQQAGTARTPDLKQGQTPATETVDPAQALADDFGPEFVGMLRQLIQKECALLMPDEVAQVPAKLDQLIAELHAERQQNHFHAIASVHADFLDVVNSPDFTTWRSSQPPDVQQDIRRVIEHGSANEIIAMLTRYKSSVQQKDASRPGDGQVIDSSAAAQTAQAKKRASQLDAAEGVRSQGVRLPRQALPQDDYEGAWDAL